jgi:peptide/nickel transport system ATP-binding protein/oligopeptide transport system ATP-binding protein
LSATSNLLEVRGLRTSFETRRGRLVAVDGVSFALAPGEVLGVVGETGSGKSVTALSLLRLVDAPGRIDRSSEIVFEGTDLMRLSEGAMRAVRGRDIAMIFQEPMTSLNPVQRVGDQIAEVLEAHADLPQPAVRERVVELLRAVGLSDPERQARRYPFELSGGMRQRVMIAMAMALTPKLLVADEPTTALDVTIQAQILELVQDLRERTGMAMLIITHDLGVVAEVTDRVAVMYAGRIVESGPTRDVLDNPRHPYTQGLLAAIPELGMSKETPLKVIPGSVPSPLAWPRGCRFAPRCEFRFDKCDAYPPLFGDAARYAACWLREADGAHEGSDG